MLIELIQQIQSEVAELKKQMLFYKQRADNAEQAYDYLMQQYKNLARSHFGSKSEKYIDPDHPQQLLFDDEDNTKSAEIEENEGPDGVTNIAAYKRKKKSNQTAPRRIVTIPVENKTCYCGCQKTVIRYETSEQYHYQQAIHEIIEERREVVACPKGCDQSIETAKKPPHVLPKIKATHALLAHIIVSKFIDRQPLYHLEKQFMQRHGMEISRRCMASWLIDLSPSYQPLLNLLKDEVIDYDISSMDATTLHVLREPGRPATKKSYAYCFRGGPPDKKVVIYEYNAENHKAYLLNWYSGFKGTIHADADPFFEDLSSHPDVNMSYCSAHARRKFEPIAKAVKTDGVAHHAMRVYKQLYKIEREAKNKKLTPDQRYQLRLEKAKPILNEFKKWLDDTYPTLLPKSPLGKAVAYVINHWDGLVHYLSDGRLEFDNNLTEQEIKMFVIIRKNFLFACSVAGAKALCAHLSLLRSAIANGLEPYRYIKAVLDALPLCQTVEDYEALLPWNINLSEAKAKEVA